MYKQFFGLIKNPFEISPDPYFYHATPRHNEALANLHYGVGRRKGFIVITGEVGTGKTLLVRCLLAELRKNNIAFAYVFNPVLPVVDSLCHAEGGLMGAPAVREALRRVQTPQAFRYKDILAAHRAWGDAPNAGDDAQVARAHGLAVALVDGDEALHKLTFASDFGGDAPALPPVRMGTGYDVHRLEEGEELWLCGVKIDHSHGLSGHSDADVAIHALVDAILGAGALGDIGQHFPPSDPQWKGASSDRFLAHAVQLAGAAGYAIGHVDVTIICEAPKIGPHRNAMRERLAGIMGVDCALVSVKATTTEKLGFTGRGEGIAAQAAATLIRR